MSKIITLTVIMTGIMLLFYFGGLIQEETNDGTCEGLTPNSKLLNILLQPECMKDSTAVSYTHLTLPTILLV